MVDLGQEFDGMGRGCLGQGMPQISRKQSMCRNGLSWLHAHKFVRINANECIIREAASSAVLLMRLTNLKPSTDVFRRSYFLGLASLQEIVQNCHTLVVASLGASQGRMHKK